MVIHIYMTFGFSRKLHLSLFNSQKILPLRFCPLEVELLLAPAKDWIDTITSGFSTNYSLSDIHIIYDQIHPDESIVAQFYSGLLRNQMMSVPVLCAYQFMQDIAPTATSVDITASRAFLKSAVSGRASLGTSAT